MKINANTKIAELVKHNPACIDAIATINKHFEKLKNPILRRVMGSRVSIKDAARIGNTDEETFYQVLKPIGFEVEEKQDASVKLENTVEVKPDFIKNIINETITELNVIKNIEEKNDPFQIITQKLKEMPPQNVLLLINSFEPVPLINILEKRGYQTYAERINDNIVHTYFKKNKDAVNQAPAETGKSVIYTNSIEMNELLSLFKDNIRTIDVRLLEMPQPMVRILEEVSEFKKGEALFVHHKKVPQYLLPELQERKLKVYINKISEGDVKLLIHL